MLTGLQTIIGLGLIPVRDAEGGGSGGGSGDDDVQKRIDEAVAGLKKTNAELKAEKTEARKLADELNAKFEKLGGDEGIEALVKMRASLENDEVGKLLAEGKHEEWFERRSAAMKADYDKQLEAAAATLAERDEALKGAKSSLHATLLDVAIGKACDKAEIKDAGAREHARMLAERQFSFDDELNGHVIKDDEGGVVYGKDGKTPKTMVEWLEEKRNVPEYRLWWPDSRSAGLSNGGLPKNPDRRMEALGNTSMADFRKIRTEQQKAAAT